MPSDPSSDPRIEAARQIVSIRADASAQERIDHLADKCTQGQLTPDERKEYESLVAAANLLAIVQSKAKAMLSGNADDKP